MSSEHKSSISNELQRAVDLLAALVVATDFSERPDVESRRGLEQAAEAVRVAARGTANGEIEQLASALEGDLRRLQSAKRSPASLEKQIERQIASLQELAARAATASAPAESEASLFSGSLAQDRELISDFLLESREHLQTIEAQALTLESEPSNAEAIHAMFRAFHTIKGLAGFLEFSVVQAVAHEIETLLDLVRRSELSITPAVIDVVLEAADCLSAWMRYIEAALGGTFQPAPSGHDALCARIHRSVEASARLADTAAADALTKLSESLAERQLPSGSETDPESGPERATRRAKSGGNELRTIKVDTAKLDYLIEMVGEMVIAQALIRHDPDLAWLKAPRLLRNISQATRITGEVQKTAMAMRMVPIGRLFRRMTRLVRDVSRKSGKCAELEIAGEETKLDRTIVEDLADPLMHMLRNAVDHGIERPEDRAAFGKPETATVCLRASHQGGSIRIEVADDGRGLDREKILAKACQRGLLEHGDQLPDSEVFQLIFEPGFSTADRITDISGRGVGMDVVKKQVQKMRGRIEIHSLPGRGTTFSIKLPLTLAIIDGLVVGLGEERYIVPIFAVQESLQPAEEAISTLPNGTETVLVRGSVIPILRLDRLFGITARAQNIRDGLLVICESGGKRFALLVDELAGKQEVVIKGLGKIVRNARGIAGGAILGDGRVGLILDIDGLIGAEDHVSVA